MELHGPEAVPVPDEIVDSVGEAEVLAVHFAPVPSAVLQAAPELRAVCVARAGLENVDVAAATARGVAVVPAFGRNATAVAELALGLMLAEARDIARPVTDPRWQVRSFVRPGQWMIMSTSPVSVVNLEWFLWVVGVPAEPGEGVYDAIAREVGAHLGGRSEVLSHRSSTVSPHQRPASGTFLGMRGRHGRGHLLRALPEGVVLNHRRHVDALCSTRAGLDPSGAE
ncbi:hypothetical protein ACWGI8_22525 [Streptomyces sp. NPDC054841]